jgi:hypothetical protein
MSVFPRIFWLLRFRLFLSDGFKNTTKNVVPKKRVDKFHKTIGQKFKTDFSRFFCLSRFWAFFDEGVKNAKKYHKYKSDPGSFLASYLTHPLRELPKYFLPAC